jgi:transposase
MTMPSSPSTSTITEMGKHAVKRRFIELRAQGHSFSKIAAELQVSKST